eukprot:Hpha_TRINITY_DN17478_c0_g1::TRINITY_DN17478_c0_g1_i1::g.85822::m.85822
MQFGFMFSLLAIVGVVVTAVQVSVPERSPTGFHVSWGQTEGELLVTWVVVNAQTAHGEGKPRCRYGDGIVSMANSKTYNDSCDAPQCTSWKGWVHTAPLMSPPRARLVYSCGDDIHGFSPPQVVVPRIDPGPEEFGFVMTADMGRDENASLVSSAIVESGLVEDPRTRFFLAVGDIAYANGNQTLWDEFHRVWEPVSRQIPTLYSPGNHDGQWVYGNNYRLPASAWVGGGESGRAYSIRLPGPGPRVIYQDYEVGTMASTSFWWSVAMGNVRVIATSGVHSFEVGSPQYAWLESELATAQERWIVVTNHFPMYCTIDDCFCGNYTEASMTQRCEPGRDGGWLPGILEVNAPFVKGALESLLLNYNVDLFLSGHEHSYERTLPVRNFTVPPSAQGKTGPGQVFVSPGAPVHLMVGTGGGSADSKWRPQGQFAWSAARSDGAVTDGSPYGFMHFSVSADRSNITATFYSKPDASSPPVPVDWFTLVKPL